MTEIKVEKSGGVAVITIDAEATRNAITGDMAASLEDAFTDADRDRATRAVVVTGAGEKAFCSGHNLKEAVNDPDTLWRPEASRCFTLPQSLTKPVVAAINGATYAGGLVLALSCDLRYCSPNTVFVASAARIGLVPIGDQVTLLPQLLPPAVVNEMLLTAAPLSAERALQHGFVNEVLPHDALLDRALEVAGEIARMPRTSMAGIKRAIGATLSHGPAAGASLEGVLSEIAGTGPEAKEGLSSFVEKRKPNFD